MRLFIHAPMRFLIHAVAHVFFHMRMAQSFFTCGFDFENAPRDINTEIVTKVVPVRAVNLSTGPFCTEFRCEQLCDEDIFRDRGQLLGPETST